MRKQLLSKLGVTGTEEMQTGGRVEAGYSYSL